MMPSLLDLSVELQLSIVEFLSPVADNDIVNLSLTCKALRAVVAPTLFKRIVLRNREESGKSVQCIVNGLYAECVRQVHYQPIIAMPQTEEFRSEDERIEPSETDFPAITEEILTGLHCFPKLDKLIVEFKWDEGDDYDAYTSGHDYFDDDIDENELRELEKKEAWRALMVHSYAALSRNGNNVKSLELRNVVPLELSIWKTPEFIKFLAGLDKFWFGIRGGESACWRINTLDGYGELMGRLDALFFEHLTNVTCFRFAATEDGPPGLEGFRHCPLPLHICRMPQLRNLEIEYCFISKQLAYFICAHSFNLERVYLANCFSGMNCGLADNPISWADFLEFLLSVEYPKLEEFSIAPVGVSLGAIYRPTVVETKAVKKTLEENPFRRVFAYAKLDDKYGELCGNDDLNLEAFLRGEDHVAFEKLMDAVEKNLQNRGHSLVAMDPE